MVVEQIVTRLAGRKIRGRLPQFLGMMLLVLVGSGFFVTLYTIVLSYNEKADDFFRSQNYADVTFYGEFSEEDVAKALKVEGVSRAQGRRVQDFRENDVVLRVISLTEDVNVPYLHEGRMPAFGDECLVIRQYAAAKYLSLGDLVAVGGRELRICGIVSSPEYVYLVQSARMPMAPKDRFGVIFVLDSGGPGLMPNGYNEIVAVGDVLDTASAIERQVGANRSVLLKDQLNYSMYRMDLDQIKTFSYLFPAVFASLIVTIVYVTLKRAISKERRQIGIYKALGLEDWKAAFIYAVQALTGSVTGALLGCLLAMFVCDTIIGIMSSMFEVPGLAFTFYPGLWIGAILVSALVCTLSALMGVWTVMGPLPAELLRARIPSGGRRLFLEKITSLWSSLSFNTRYALKSAFRNKGRFFAVALGMCGSCALLSFALGFSDSVRHTQSAYFEDFARYDVMIEVSPMPLGFEHPAITRLDSAGKAFGIPASINGKEYQLLIVEDDFDMQSIDTRVLDTGIIVPAYHAKKWGVDVGDQLLVNDVPVNVAGLSEQSLGLAFYACFDYAKRVFPDMPAVYNMIFGRDADLAEVTSWLDEAGYPYSTLEDDLRSFSSTMETLDVLVWFMLGCAIILGLTALYSVGLMNLSTREYEYMFMSVMGYPLSSIMLAHLKEAALQLLIAVPSGLAAGYGLILLIKDSFSGDVFVIFPAVYSRTYIYAATIVVAITAAMALITARRVDGLDIVEGLKARDE